MANQNSLVSTEIQRSACENFAAKNGFTLLEKSPDRSNLSNHKETPFLYFLNIISQRGTSAVITDRINGALSARKKAWFWVERSNHWWSLIMTTSFRRLYNLTVPS